MTFFYYLKTEEGKANTLFFHFSKRFMRITVFHSRGIYF